MDARKVDPAKMLGISESGVIAVMLQDNTIALHLPTHITDKDIDDLIRQVMPKVLQYQQGCVCAFIGFDNDPRELFEIPEAIEFAKRLIDSGFISMLHISTLMEKEEKPYLAKVFGAMEVWALGTGCLTKDGDLSIGEAESKEFLAALARGNRKKALTVYPTTTDGMHRTKIEGLI